MATEEQLKVTIQTAADLSGAKQVQGALQQLTVQQVAANDALRRTMAAGPQTIQAFRQNVKEIGGLIGQPTLGPEAFGITTEATRQVEEHTQATRAATVVVREHADAQVETGRAVHLTASEFARFATAAIGIGGGLSIAATAGQLLQTALTNILQQAMATDQSIRNLTATFGTAAAQYQQFIATASRAPGGFGENDIRAALEAERPLGEQYHLTSNQLEGLITSAQKLATIRNIPLADALAAMTAALQGSSGAAEKLGLSMTDQQVAARAAGGAYQQTFTTLTGGEKVMLRYIELLKQVDTQQNNVAGSGKSVNTSAKELENSVNRLNAILGQGPMSGLLELFKALGAGMQGSTDTQRVALDKSKQQVQDWSTYVDQVWRDTTGKIQSTTGAPTDPVLGPQVQSQARLDFYDQIKDAARNVLLAQIGQHQLQRESVQLSAEEARIKLGLLPAQQQMAELQRQMTEQQIRARQYALGPQEVLEDLRYMQQRDSLILQDRSRTVAERAAARRELRGLTR